MYFLNKQAGCAGREDQSKKVSYLDRLDGIETRSYPLTCIQMHQEAEVKAVRLRQWADVLEWRLGAEPVAG